MTKLSKFDRKNAAAIHTEAALLLAPLLEKYGIKIKQGGGTVDDSKITLKFDFTLAGEAGVAAEQADFVRHANLFGCQPSDYGKTATINGKEAVLVGFSLGRSKYPVRLRHTTGKVFVYGTEVLQKYFSTGHAPYRGTLAEDLSASNSGLTK